jgi:hypothetical protein
MTKACAFGKDGAVQSAFGNEGWREGRGRLRPGAEQGGRTARQGTARRAPAQQLPLDSLVVIQELGAGGIAPSPVPWMISNGKNGPRGSDGRWRPGGASPHLLLARASAASLCCVASLVVV